MSDLKWRTLRLVVLFCACGAMLIGCGESTPLYQSGFHLYVRADVEAASELKSLSVSFRQALVQLRGFEIEDGWESIQLLEQNIDLVDFQKEASIRVATGELNAGDYERVFLEVQYIDATVKSGEPLEVSNVVEPIALPFDYDGSVARMALLDLLLLRDIGSAPPTYSLYCRDIRLTEN